MATDVSLSPKTNVRQTNAQEAGICLDGLSVSLDQAPLFLNLSHHFPSGEWSCLLGTSGVGKSMLLRAILGLLDGPGVRNVSMQGRISTTDGSPLRHQVAYMAQQDLLMPWLSVRGNVLLGTRLRGRPAPDIARSDTIRADELLEKTGLLNRANDLPAQLSGGMRQRVALARTLFEDKPIVLMDEPFSALDAISRLHAQDLACRLLSGRTVVMVTHDPLEAIRLADRIYVLSGTPATLAPPITPVGTAPRAVDNDAVLTMQGELLNALRHSRHG